MGPWGVHCAPQDNRNKLQKIINNVNQAHRNKNKKSINDLNKILTNLYTQIHSLTKYQYDNNRFRKSYPFTPYELEHSRFLKNHQNTGQKIRNLIQKKKAIQERESAFFKQIKTPNVRKTARFMTKW